MSISSELLTLQNTKTAIRTAINNKGGSVGANDTFASYATAITNLPSGGSDSTLRDLIERDITSITIPIGTTGIGNNAFNGCSSLPSINIPSGVTSIGMSAFQNCTSLTSINISDSVTTIGSYAFGNCSSLPSINIPSGVTSIEQQAFSYCTSLTSITIPSGTTIIGNNAFTGCSSLTSVTCLATTPPTIATNTFNNTNNCPIYVPAASVDTYKAATNWSTYASRIYPITQLATVDGNPVYNYELGNTSSTTILSTEMEKMPTGASIEFAEGLTNMGGSISGYTTVTLPSTFATFNDQNMIGSSVTTLTMKSTTPPMAERNNLGGAGLTAIYVPASAVDTYKAASGWSNFASIIQGLPSPTPSVTSITFAQYKEATSPDDRGDFEGCSSTVNVDAFESTGSTGSDAFDSDIKAAGIVLVEDNNGNDITSQCTFSSNDYSVWDSTQDPEYDGESEAYYEWRLDTNIEDADAQNPHSATITATYGNLSDDFTIEWTTTSNCEEPEPEPEPDPEEPEE